MLLPRFLQIAFAAAFLAGPQGASRVPQFSSGSNLVVLSATAVDRDGRPVSGLKAKDFQVFEEGRLQKIAHFALGHEAAARILLLVDASGSMNGELKTASSKMVALQILAALDPADEAALAGFDQKYWGVVKFTRDRQQIADAFGELEPFGSTALHDALDHAARDLASHGEGRRAVVVITDGVDTASQKTADEVIASSRALDVPIYAVSVLSPIDDPESPLFTGHERPAAATAGSATLARYAQLSGGAAFAVSDFKGLKEATTQIVSELKQQYRLGYEQPSGPSRFRRIEVRASRRGVVVKTRSGYVPQS
jgi:Ca-activated chloride channel family protein